MVIRKGQETNLGKLTLAEAAAKGLGPTDKLLDLAIRARYASETAEKLRQAQSALLAKHLEEAKQKAKVAVTNEPIDATLVS